MSESNGVYLIKIPTGRAKAEFADGRVFEFGIVTAREKVGAIIAGAADKKGYWYLRELVAWVKETGGPDITVDEANALWFEILAAEKKSEGRLNRLLDDAPTSPSSTGSTPAA